MDDYKRSHIPAFGNWDYEDGLPITQYFESARQAGLIRYSYAEEDLYSYSTAPAYFDQNHDKDLYLKPTNTTIDVVQRRKKRQVRVYDVEQTARQQQQQSATLRVPKAVDEDLYKIPPELLYKTYPKKKKRFGFFSKCLVPSCAA
ncbi:ubiquitin hydrolase [Thalictrum thalictroides]|uniref:Ubiquitin hydrolase n=1 Tax=Thalictrum thalictroides TaxID=46969 RepID=A0A7J6V3I7_THATH|nr:ubiquitin hydrolase [Thalictrum thalictroides]